MLIAEDARECPSGRMLFRFLVDKRVVVLEQERERYDQRNTDKDNENVEDDILAHGAGFTHEVFSGGYSEGLRRYGRGRHTESSLFGAEKRRCLFYEEQKDGLYLRPGRLFDSALPVLETRKRIFRHDGTE